MTERTTVRLPDGLLRRAKRRAMDEKRTLTSLIEEGLQVVLAEKPIARPTQRVRLPVSRATGGVLPGIDVDDLTSLQETEDLDYVSRMMRGG